VIGLAPGLVKAALELPWLLVDWTGPETPTFDIFRQELRRQRSEISDPRLTILPDDDARETLRRSPRMYDIILIADFSLASSEVARCETTEFFRTARSALTDQAGVVAFCSQSLPQRRLAQEVGCAVMARRALQTVFASVGAIRAPAEMCLLATPARQGGFPDIAAWQERMNRWRWRRRDSPRRRGASPKRRN